MTHSLIDIGLNLTHDSFDTDRDALMQRAAEAGVTHMIVTGSSPAASQQAIELAVAYPDTLRATAGIHPHHASGFAATDVDQLRALMTHPSVVACGECGLDYFRDFSPRADQEHVFRLQLELACVIGKPLFLHQRDAHDAFIAILREYWPRLHGGVAHCFTAGLAEARAYLDLGLYIGITGWLCDERRGAHLKEVVRYIPRDRLLVETDAPYLLPRDLRPKPASRRNEPMHLPHIVSQIAACRNEDAAAVANATATNTRTLFGWPNT